MPRPGGPVIPHSGSCPETPGSADLPSCYAAFLLEEPGCLLCYPLAFGEVRTSCPARVVPATPSSRSAILAAAASLFLLLRVGGTLLATPCALEPGAALWKLPGPAVPFPLSARGSLLFLPKAFLACFAVGCDGQFGHQVASPVSLQGLSVCLRKCAIDPVFGFDLINRRSHALFSGQVQSAGPGVH